MRDLIHRLRWLAGDCGLLYWLAWLVRIKGKEKAMMEFLQVPPEVQHLQVQVVIEVARYLQLPTVTYLITAYSTKPCNIGRCSIHHCTYLRYVPYLLLTWWCGSVKVHGLIIPIEYWYHSIINTILVYQQPGRRSRRLSWYLSNKQKLPNSSIPFTRFIWLEQPLFTVPTRYLPR